MISDYWATLLYAWPYGEQWLFAFGTWVAHNIPWFSLNLMYIILDRYSLLQQYKIQKNRFPSKRLLIDCTKEAVINQFVMFIGFYITYPLFKWRGMRSDLPLPSAFEVIRDLTVSLILCDALFYWVHRTLHAVPFFYKHIHAQHHRFITPIGAAAEYSHPVENIFAAFIPTFAGCLVMGSHMFTVFLWMCIRMVETIEAHSGYRLPFSILTYLPFMLGQDGHDWHHSHNRGNYGMTKFWDWLCGTDAEYKKWLKNPQYIDDKKTQENSKKSL